MVRPLLVSMVETMPLDLSSRVAVPLGERSTVRPPGAVLKTAVPGVQGPEAGGGRWAGRVRGAAQKGAEVAALANAMVVPTASNASQVTGSSRPLAGHWQ
jgi:hypothetical protein